MNVRYRGRWKRGQVIGTAGSQLRRQRARFAHQPLDIDCHTARTVRSQLGEPVPEFRHGSLPVAPPPVVEADANLQDALVEVAHLVRLANPDAFERLVLLEKFLAVELLDAVQQGIGRRVIAAGGAARRGLLEVRLHADCWPAADARTMSPSGEAAGSSR